MAKASMSAEEAKQAAQRRGIFKGIAPIGVDVDSTPGMVAAQSDAVTPAPVVDPGQADKAISAPVVDPGQADKAISTPGAMPQPSEEEAQNVRTKSRGTTIYFYDDNREYLEVVSKAKKMSLTEYVNWLTDKDKEGNAEVLRLMKQLDEAMNRQ